jgi:hypothetical protein
MMVADATLKYDGNFQHGLLTVKISDYWQLVVSLDHKITDSPRQICQRDHVRHIPNIYNYFKL